MIKSKLTRRLASVILVGALAIGAAACGGDDPDPSQEQLEELDREL